MGFNLSNLFSYHTNKETYGASSAVETDSAGAGRETEHMLSARELSAFAKGSSVTGQVVSMEGDTVKIKLSDDAYVNARLEQKMQVLVGQRLTFEVKSNSGSTLSLIPLFTNLNTGTNVIKGLEAANIPVNDDSVSMIMAMMDKGMSIDAGALQNMYRQVMTYPQASPADLVEMRQLSIPITEENLVQFEAYKNYEHQILAGIEEIADSLEQTCLDMIRAGDMQEAAAIYKEVTAMLSEGEMLPKEAEIFGNEEEMVPVETDSQPEKILIRDLGDLGIEGTVAGTADDGTAERVAKSSALLAKEDIPFSSRENELATDNERPAQEWELSGLLKRPERTVLSQHLTELGVSEKITQAVKEGNISYKQLFSLLSKVSEEKQLAEPLQKLYASKEFGTLIKDRMMKQLLLEPETVGEEGKVSEYYEKLKQQTQRLTDTLSMVGKENSNLFKSVDGLRQNMDFMNQVNQAFTYVQLPLKFSQGSGNGDLYVYTNKKNLARNDGSISALLHLDMENLGAVDVYVTMTGSERVSTKFYLKDEDMLAFIESHIHILNERLEKRGYLLKTEVTVKKEEKSFADRLAGGEEEEKRMLLSRQAFDVRA
ncbi:MAG: flagellar hook-length control protein FliK [Lachnospiraceae bacterium]|nr:flagellar hook-length control protein FliK [Lachnospiraceae bacterium]